MTSVQAGEVEAVHASTLANLYRQQLVQVEGQTDVVIFGLPYIGPYNVNSIMNPLLVMCFGLGYFFNFYRGNPLVRPGGASSSPTPPRGPSTPSTTRRTSTSSTRCWPHTDPLEIEKGYEERFATDEWYRHLYRTSYAFHGVHALYMWYWGAHALDYVGGVIIVGGDRPAVRRMGFRPASTMADALEMAEDSSGLAPITHLHAPPLLMADVCVSVRSPASSAARSRPTWPVSVPRPRKPSIWGCTTARMGALAPWARAVHRLLVTA